VCVALGETGNDGTCDNYSGKSKEGSADVGEACTLAHNGRKHCRDEQCLRNDKSRGCDPERGRQNDVAAGRSRNLEELWIKRLHAGLVLQQFLGN
jgi:hypothetical protein